MIRLDRAILAFLCSATAPAAMCGDEVFAPSVGPTLSRTPVEMTQTDTRSLMTTPSAQFTVAPDAAAIQLLERDAWKTARAGDHLELPTTSTENGERHSTCTFCSTWMP